MQARARRRAFHTLRRSAAVAAFVCIAALSFASCASTRTASSAHSAPNAAESLNPVYVTNRKRVALLPPSAIGAPLDAVQHITADFRGQAFAADCLLVADERQLFMTVLNDFGTTLATLAYDSSGVSFESSVFPAQMKAEYVVFDVQLCFFRPDALMAALMAASLRMEVASERGAEIRSVYDGRKEIIRIEKTAGRIVYQNLLRGYRYTLEGAY